MTGVWPLVTGLPMGLPTGLGLTMGLGLPGTLGTVSLLSEGSGVSLPFLLDSSLFITAVVTLLSPFSRPFLPPSDSLIALNPPQIPLDIFTSPFSKLPLEEEEEDCLLLKGAAFSMMDIDAPDLACGVRAPFELLNAPFGEGLLGSAD